MWGITREREKFEYNSVGGVLLSGCGAGGVAYNRVALRSLSPEYTCDARSLTDIG